MSRLPDHSLVGQKVGEYDITAQVGRGGMGAVYEGLQSVIGKRVAVKVLLPHLSSDEELVQRFIAEARAVNAIRHRGIVDIFSFGQLPGGSHYFVMEFLEGQPFDVLLKQRGPLPPGSVLAMLEEALDALDAAHSTGIIHRDIKPSNLFLVNTGRGRPYLKLLDFGIAKLTLKTGPGTPETRASVVIGTPTYMAPEQARGEKLTAKVDLYALGCLAYEALTGQLPYRAENMAQMMFAHIEQPTPHARDLNSDVPEEIDEVVHAMMQKRPHERPESAAVLRDEVASMRPSYADSLFLSVPTPSPGATRVAPRTPAPSVQTLAAPLSVEEQPTRVGRAPLPPTTATMPPPSSGRSRWPFALVGLAMVSGALTWGVLRFVVAPAPRAEPPPKPAFITEQPPEPESAPVPAPAPFDSALRAPLRVDEEVAQPRVKKSAPRTPTTAELKSRVVRLESRAKAKQEKTGDPDPVLEKFIGQAKGLVASAENDDQRRRAHQFLSEIERQLDGR